MSGGRIGAIAGAIALLAACGCGGEALAPGDAASSVPEPTASGLRIGDPRALEKGTSAWAPVVRPTAVRALPREDARAVAQLETQTPEGTQNIVALASGDGAGPARRGWVRVGVAALPNGTTGWVPRSALGGYSVVDTRLVVDLGAERIVLLRGGRQVLSAPVGVGTLDAPTPPGEFYVRNRLTRYESPAYGPLAFGTSARAPTLTDWPAGGFVGIHGTDRPELLPGRVSHGCIRMRNEDILRLGKLLPIGTPVTIRAA
jgi:lipoprotein-anchoring transpeptidase ErfK/SrfK